MNRTEMLKKCKDCPNNWDLIIIGGGATGLGSALDAASRGFKTLLLEQSDFAKGTSSRSTKLIHGGLRYLKQGNLTLVIEALRERGLLCQNAPHLVSPLGFLVPNYHWWEGPFYGIGLKVYDLLAGKLGLQSSYTLTREETLNRLPNLEPKDLLGGTVYFDGQFDDARLAITLAQTAADQGATLINYMEVTSLIKENDLIVGVEATDLESKERYCLHSKCVINATGVFTDNIRKLDNLESEPIITPSQGIHIVLDKSFLPSDFAILVPETDDGRVLFFVPWHEHLLIGTTDTAVLKPTLEPKPLENEVDFLLDYAGKYLIKKPKRSDILSVFAGLRPLVKSGDKSTSATSREHEIIIAESGLITICGGKWTTYRKMAQDVIDKAIMLAHLKEIPCATEHLRLHGFKENPTHPIQVWSLYGSDSEKLFQLIKENPSWDKPLHPRLPYLPVEVIWAVRNEMAIHLEDVLSRRTRSLLLDAKASLEIAPHVAKLMAQEMGKDSSWEKSELEHFTKLAWDYLAH